MREVKRRPARADHTSMEASSLPLGRPVRRRIGRRALAVSVLALAALWFVAHKHVSYYKVTSGSMEPTLQIGQRVAAESTHSPQLGDIVLFHPPAGARPQNPQCGASGRGPRIQPAVWHPRAAAVELHVRQARDRRPR